MINLSFPDAPLVINAQTALVFNLDFSNDGSMLAVARVAPAGGGSIAIYNARDGNLRYELLSDYPQAVGVAFTADGSAVYSVTRSADLAFHLIRSELASSRHERLATFAPAEFCHTIARDRRTNYIAVLGVSADIIQTRDHKIVRSHEGNARDPLVAAFDPEGLHFFTWQPSAPVIDVIDLAADKLKTQLPAPSTRGRQLLVSPSGEFLLASSVAARGVFLYSLESEARVAENELNERRAATYFAFTADSRQLTSYSLSFAAFQLPGGERVLGPNAGLAGRVTAASAAYERPVIAFAKGTSVVCVELKATEETG